MAAKRQAKGRRKEQPSGDYVKKSSAVFAVIVALAFGIFLGVTVPSMFGPKTAQGPGQMPAQAPAAGGSVFDDLRARAEANPGNADGWIQLGHAYFDNNRPNEAIEAYERALAIKPGNPGVLTDLGVMYRRAGDPRKAIECFDKAIALEPKLEQARFNKGVVLLHDLNDTQGAVQAWEALLAVNPGALAPDGTPVAGIVEQYKSDAKPSLLEK